MRYRYFIIPALMFFAFAGLAFAEEKAGVAPRIIRPMIVLDSTTLQTDDGTTVHLWGVDPLPPSGSPLQLKAIETLETLINAQPVNCKIIYGTIPNVVASCAGYTGSDMGLVLLNRGYAVVNRRHLAGSPFAPPYTKAQEEARLKEKGIWRYIANEDRETRVPAWLKPQLPILVPLALFLGPLSSILITLIMMRIWLAKITSLHDEDLARDTRKESTLSARERSVLISALEGELTENRNKVTAFSWVYNDMLRTLKATEEVPRYQRVGDIVQKYPSLSKTVFEANVSKLSVLDIHLAGQLSKLYTALPNDHEYITLDPTMPVEQAVEAVEGVLQKADALLPMLDEMISALHAALTVKTSTPPAA